MEQYKMLQKNSKKKSRQKILVISLTLNTRIQFPALIIDYNMFLVPVLQKLRKNCFKLVTNRLFNQETKFSTLHQVFCLKKFTPKTN